MGQCQGRKFGFDSREDGVEYSVLSPTAEVLIGGEMRAIEITWEMLEDNLATRPPGVVRVAARDIVSQNPIKPD